MDSVCYSDTGTNSNIKDWVDERSNFEELLTESYFCNDTSSQAMNRITNTNPSPTFKCPSTDQNYGGTYKLKFGLLSADELIFAGMKYGTINTSNYLKRNAWYWTMTPYNSNYVFYVSSSGYLTYTNASSSSTSSVMIAYNLKHNIQITSGSGTSSSPWVIKTN